MGMPHIFTRHKKSLSFSNYPHLSYRIHVILKVSCLIKILSLPDNMVVWEIMTLR